MSWRTPSTNDGPGRRGAHTTVSVAALQETLRSSVGRRTKLAVAAAVVGLGVMWIGASGTNPGADRATLPATAPMIEAEPSPVPEPTYPPILDSPDRAVYWIGIHELGGVTPDLAPGTPIEVWVTWEPPLVDEPTVHRLIKNAYIHRILPSTSVAGSMDVGLSVRNGWVRDLMFGHRFGVLDIVVTEK